MKILRTIMKTVGPKLDDTGFDHVFLGVAFVVVFSLTGALCYVYLNAATTNYPVLNANGKCLDNQSDRKIGGNPVQIFRCNATPAQKWTAKADGTIVNSNGMCLSAEGKTLESLVTVRNCTGIPRQLWTVNTSTKTIVSQASGFCLDNKNDLAMDSNPVWLFTCNSTPAQRWLPQFSEPLPTIGAFTATPATVDVGGTTTLKWTTTNSTSCTVTPGGPVNTTTKSWVTPALATAGTKTYTLSCQNSEGTTVSRAVRISVGTTPPPPSSSLSFIVSSYNILNSEYFPKGSRAIGGCDVAPVAGDPRCAKTRGERQVRIITGSASTQENPAFDIIGLQEISPEQYSYFANNLHGYGIYADPNRLTPTKDGNVAILWNKSKFEKFAEGKAPALSNTAQPVTNPWVGLRAANGHKVFVMSVHYANDSHGGTPAAVRRSANLTLDWVRQKQGPNTTVIVTGDFNDKLSEKLHYCKFTQGGLMQHAVDMQAKANVNAGCSANRYDRIDHIYATPGAVSAKGWTQMPNTGAVARASDHVPVYATYTIK